MFACWWLLGLRCLGVSGLCTLVLWLVWLFWFAGFCVTGSVFRVSRLVLCCFCRVALCWCFVL